jgi:protein dithiol oxidoreductase (disulfide-forming)
MMSVRQIAAFAGALLITLAASAIAQTRAPWTQLNPPQPAEEGGKIEVLEFFWYGCPHCYHLEPAIATWQKNAPKDVVFKRIPAAHGGWANLAAVYYTLESMGQLEQLHGKVFDAIHKQNINLGNKNLRDEWLAKQGVDVAKYNDVEKSFAVMTKVQRAKQMSASYKVESVPQLVVNGRYVISSETAGGMERMMPAVDAAILVARREKTASAPAPAEPAKR